MKNLIYLLLITISICSCNNDDDNTPQNPVDQHPPPTQTGENTFGCLVNGKSFIVENTTKLVGIYQGGLLQLGADYEIEDVDQGITIWLERQNLTEETYILNENGLNIAFFRDINSECLEYYTFNPDSGSITIENFDDEQFTISGSFEFETMSNNCQEIISITEGRFDVHYIP